MDAFTDDFFFWTHQALTNQYYSLETVPLRPSSAEEARKRLGHNSPKCVWKTGYSAPAFQNCGQKYSFDP